MGTQPTADLKKYRTIKDDPQYLGGYLNSARHNVYLLISHLTETFSHLNFPKINDDEEISKDTHILAQIFNPENSDFELERQKIYNYLLKRHHLPLIKIFNSETTTEGKDSYIDYSKLHRFLKQSFQALVDLRNSFSHYLAIDDDGNKTERNREIHDDIVSDIELLFKHAPRFSFIRNQQTQQEEDYSHLKNYRLFDTETPNRFTDQGLYFFVNLFLERSQATKFLKRFKGFKNETTPPFRATIQAFTSYALKVPDVRLRNENPKHMLLMEMLTELNRCPKELFYHLTDADKKEFEPKLKEEGKQNIVLNSTNYEDIRDEDLEEAIKELTAFKRHRDRFPYFALRFLEETDALKNIRFQITLGKLIVNRYDKKILKDRRVIKIVNAFGKLKDFLDKEDDILKTLKEGIEDNDIIQFEQFAPHYNMSNNKIAFYIFNDGDEKVKYPNLFENKKDQTEFQNNPSGFISIHDLPKLLTLESLVPQKGEQLIADFIQNTNLELFDKQGLDQLKKDCNFNPIMFTKRLPGERVLKGKSGKIDYLSNEVENELVEWLGMSKEEILSLDKPAFKEITKDTKAIEFFSQIKYRHLLEQRREELQKHLPASLSIKMFPSRILDYLMDIQGVPEDKTVHEKIKGIKDDAKWRLKSLKKELEKPITERKIKLGELATFVAQDMINMLIDESVKQKITTPYYSKLQNKIAFFSLNKAEIIELCDELQLFNHEVGHVFLTKDLILGSKGIIDFYLKYLGDKVSWIEKVLFVPGKKGGYRFPEFGEIPFSFETIKRNVGTQDFDKWLINKSQKPVELPRTIFDVQLIQILKGKLSALGFSFNDKDKFTVLLSNYLREDSQPFYRYKRNYRLGEDESIEFFIKGLSSKRIKETYGRFAASNEKLIRFTQTKDLVLKLLCDKLLAEDKSVGLKERFLLQEIHPLSEHNPLESHATFEQKILRKGKAVYFTVSAQDNARQLGEVEKYRSLKTEEEKQNYDGQKWYQWTVKDFGRFKRFVSDRRIPHLADYYDTSEIPFDLLEYQIKEYDKYREKVFELTFGLEQAIAEKDFSGISQIEFGKHARPKGFCEVQFQTTNTTPSKM